MEQLRTRRAGLGALLGGLLLMAAYAPVFAADIEVSQPVQVTDSEYYERGQAIVYDGSDYWLFYGRSATVTGWYQDGNPDISDYAIHYKKAATVAGLAAATAQAVPGAANCYIGEIGAAVVDGKVWTFASLPSTPYPGRRSLNGWYTTDGSSWTQVVGLADNLPDGSAHHDETGFGGELHVMANHPDGLSGWHTRHTDDPTADPIVWTSWVPLNSTVNLVNGTGHFYVEGADLYIGILRTNPSSDNKILAYVADPEGWTELCTASSLGYDPTLLKAGSTYLFAQAPYNSGEQKQWIIGWAGSDLNTLLGGDAQPVTEGGYGTNTWVDMWPIGFTDAGGASYLFYTSERDQDDPAQEQTGNIWYLEVSETGSVVPGRDHYTWLQEAVDGAAAGDAIHVDAGTYVEQVHVQTADLALIGAGVDDTFIQSPAALTDFFVTGTNNNYPVVFVDGVTGLTLQDLTVDGDHQGDANYRFVGVGFWNGDGALNACRVVNVMNSVFSGAQHGVGVYAYNDTGGPYSIVMDDVSVLDFQKGGIVLLGDGLAVDLDEVDATGYGPTDVTAQNGIQIGNGATGTLNGCTISDIAYTGESWTATGFLVLGGTDVEATDCVITGCESSAYYQDATGAMHTCSIASPLGHGVLGYSTGAKGGGLAPLLEPILPQPLDEAPRGPRSPVVLELDRCTLTGAGPAAEAYGYISWAAGPVDITITGCAFSDWYAGFGTAEYGANHTTSVTGNSFVNCDYVGDTSEPGVQDASGNWCGVVDTAQVAAKFYGNIDYTPWLADGTDTSADPGFQGDFSVLWVDDDSPQGGGGGGRIQEAVDLVTGSTVNVAAGTYREQLVIDKDLDLVGAGRDVCTIEAVDLGDRTTYEITSWLGGSSAIDPCIGVVGPATVNISGLTVNGRDLGPDQFYGIHFCDASGSVTDCRLDSIIYASSPGAQKVVSLCATHGDGGSYALAVSGCDIPVFQKGGICVMGPGATCTLSDNTIASMPSPNNAGNGIQVSYGAAGTVSGNTVSGVAYTGEDWAATGILLFESGDVTVTGGVVSECQSGVNHTQWNWIHTPSGTPGVTVDGVELDRCDYAVSTHLGGVSASLDLEVRDCYAHGGTYSAVDLWGSDVDPWGGGYYPGWSSGVLTAVIEDCVLAGGDGIVEWVELPGNTVSVTAHGNDLSGNGDYGVYNNYAANTIDAEDNWWGDAAGPVLVTPPKRGGGARPSISPYTVGEPLSAPPRPAGLLPAMGENERVGVNVSPYVDYDPWRTGNVICVPDPATIADATPDHAAEVVCDYLGGGSGLVFGYSIDVTWDSSVITATPGDFKRPDYGAFSSAGLFAVTPITGGVRIGAGLGNGHPGIASGELFKATFTAAAGVTDYATSDLAITITYMRDYLNEDLTGFTADDGLVIVDLAAPSVTAVAIANQTLTHTDDYVKNGDDIQVTATVGDADPAFGGGGITADLSGFGGGAAAPPDSYTGGVATWSLAGVTTTPADGAVTVTVTATDGLGNSASDDDDITADNTKPSAMTGLAAAPGYRRVELAWDDASGNDAHYDGVVVRHVKWDDYPWYATAAPAYPADHTAGDGTVIEGDHTAATHTFDPDLRGIYYYGGFVYDAARNYSDPDAGGRDRSTNYWLGDVFFTPPATGPYDGYVNSSDATQLGASYGLHSVDPGFKEECDVGPTDTHQGDGIPLPDTYVEFEDLMIFALNYGVVAPRPLPQDGATELPQLAWQQVETDVWALSLLAPCHDLKGLRLTADLPAGSVTGVATGSLLGQQAGPSFLRNVDANGLDLGLALMGRGLVIAGSGELARVSFAEGTAPATVEIAARTGANEPLALDLTAEETPATPAVYRLGQNFPNPFNPKTTICFDLPSPQETRLTIFAADGRRVITLLDAALPTGSHTAVWDGRDAAGHPAASGVYFYRIDAGPLQETRKMLLLK